LAPGPPHLSPSFNWFFQHPLFCGLSPLVALLICPGASPLWPPRGPSFYSLTKPETRRLRDVSPPPLDGFPRSLRPHPSHVTVQTSSPPVDPLALVLFFSRYPLSEFEPPPKRTSTPFQGPFASGQLFCQLAPPSPNLTIRPQVTHHIPCFLLTAPPLMEPLELAADFSDPKQNAFSLSHVFRDWWYMNRVGCEFFNLFT